MQDELIFVGYTNGYQILYATEINGVIVNEAARLADALLAELDQTGDTK